MKLPQLFKQHSVKTILDAPCGDFNWIQHVVPVLDDIEYIGADIVQELVYHNQRKFGTNGVSFRQLDITSDPLPAADLMLVKDCLIHLSNADALRFFRNFLRSDIGLILTNSSWPDDRENCDIITGNWRRIHLFSPPFSLPAPLERIDLGPLFEADLCLWSQGQIMASFSEPR